MYLFILQGENGRITYNISSINPQSQPSYFYVNPVSGDLTVTTLLSAIKNGPKQYIVSCSNSYYYYIINNVKLFL